MTEMGELGKVSNPTVTSQISPAPLEPARPTSPTDNERTQAPEKNQESQRAEALHQAREERQEPTTDQAREWTTNANSILSSLNLSMHFQVHERSNRWYVQLIDDDSGEVVREIPSKEMLQMAARLREVIENLRSNSGKALGTFLNEIA